MVDAIAHRPQVQERITEQIADTIADALAPRGALVVVEARHMCMSHRGVRKHGSLTITSTGRGELAEPVAQREAMAFLAQHQTGR